VGQEYDGLDGMAESVTRADSAPQGALQVRPVCGPADRRRFVELPYALYARDPFWVPPLRRDERRRLSPRHNPFHAHADIRLWLAWRHGQVVGRIAAIDDWRHNDTHQERVTWFGFFEACDDAAARELLSAVEQHARHRGSGTVRGPANPSLNDSVGLLVDAFDEEPCVLMPYNPASYPRFVERAGFQKAKDLLAWDIDMAQPLSDRLTRLADRIARQSGVRLRPVRTTRRGFAEDLDHLKTIYRAAWEPNWGFVAPTDAEITHLARDLKPILDPELVLFAEADGQPVGVAVAVPDVNQVLKHMNGRLLPFGFVQFLWRKRSISRARVLLLGVLPPYQRKGLYPLLIAELHRRGRIGGYRRGELSWTLEDNEAVNAGIVAAGGRHHKTYRLYEKPIG